MSGANFYGMAKLTAGFRRFTADTEFRRYVQTEVLAEEVSM